MSIPHVNGLPGLQKYIPELYHPLFMEKFYDTLFLNQICNRDYEGEIKNKGDAVWIRQLPDGHTHPYKKGMTLSHEELDAEPVKFVVDRARYWAFKVDRIDELLTDMKGFASKVAAEYDKQLAVDIETEFFASVFDDCDASNKGNAAGKDGTYRLGTDASPVYVSANGSGSKTGADSSNKVPAVDLIATAAAALQDQKGGMGNDPWIVIPPSMGLRIQTGELKDASLAGDPQSLLRKDVRAVGTLAGFSVYTSNLLNAAVSGGNRIYHIMFGDRKAITYADQITDSEIKPIENGFGNKFQALHTYDWKALHPTRFGCICAIMA